MPPARRATGSARYSTFRSTDGVNIASPTHRSSSNPVAPIVPVHAPWTGRGDDHRDGRRDELDPLAAYSVAEQLTRVRSSSGWRRARSFYVPDPDPLGMLVATANRRQRRRDQLDSGQLVPIGQTGASVDDRRSRITVSIGGVQVASMASAGRPGGRARDRLDDLINASAATSPSRSSARGRAVP